MTKSDEKKYENYKVVVRETEEKIWKIEVDEMVNNGEDHFVKEIGKILKKNFCGYSSGTMFGKEVFMDLLEIHDNLRKGVTYPKEVK